jgi:hypothetical protein
MCPHDNANAAPTLPIRPYPRIPEFKLTESFAPWYLRSMQSSSRLQVAGTALCAGLLAIAVYGAWLCQPTIAGAQAAGCVGDCSADTEVTVNELIVMVNIALGTSPISACPVGDANGDGEITVNEIITAVNNALNGCPSGLPVCGDGVTEAGEECDNGGICAGGDNAGTACTSDTTCHGQGSCFDGPNANRACANDTDCPNSTCTHCRPFGGDGCAANCTMESDIMVNLKPGGLLDPNDPLSLDPTTSGVVVHGDILTLAILLPGGGSETFTVGKEKNGKIPAVIRAGNLNLPRLPVSTLACACLRGLELKTCGGTLNDSDGAPSIDCTDDFTAGPAACAGKKPCAAVFGPGNVGGLFSGCSSLDGANLTITQDSGGSGPGGPPIVTLSGAGPAGSAVLQTALSLGFVIGSCSGSGPDYGTDGEFCSDDDSQSSRGTVQPATLVTASATATITGANGDSTLDIGPFSAMGIPLSCSAIGSGNASGSALAGAFTELDAETIGDIVVTSVFASE